MKRNTRSVNLPPAVDLEKNMEKSDDGSPKKVRKRAKRNLIKDYLMEYTSNSNLHGLKYIGEKERTYVEKIFWILMFTCCIVVCSVYIAKAYNKWNRSPVIVSFAENTIPVIKIPFPAVTVCLETKAMQSKYNFTKYFHLYDGSETYGNLTDQERFDFEDVSLVCASHLSPARGRKFSRGVDTVNTLKKVCPNITEVFFACKWKDVNENYCSEIFSPIVTEEGICYTYNILDADQLLRQEKLHTDYQYLELSFENVTPWTLEDGYPDDTPIETYPHRASGYAAKAGLSFVLKASEVDLDYLCRGPVQGYKIRLHNPAEFPRLSQQYFRAPLGHEVVVAIKPKMTSTSEGLLSYSPEIRDCYFSSERYLQYFKVYTQANCELECRSNFSHVRCGCVPFGLPYGPSMRVCNAGSTKCLQNAEMELEIIAAQTRLNKDNTDGKWTNSTWRLARDVASRCKCKPSCTSIEYEAETSQVDFNWRAIFTSYQYPIDQTLNDVYLTRIIIFFKEAQFVTSRRSELYDQTDILASCGGLLGLFMGFSFLSVVEILYFLTLRLWCSLRKKTSQNCIAYGNQA